MITNNFTVPMRFVVLIVSMLILSGCGNNFNITTPDLLSDPVKTLSRTQGHIKALRGAMVKMYRSAPNTLTKQELVEMFQKDLHKYLADTIQLVMDSMRVKISRLSLNESTINATFEDDQANYNFSGHFKSESAMRSSPIYKYVKGLKEGSDTTMILFYLGNCSINNPDNEFMNTFDIEVVPGPLGMPLNKKKR